ncbi:MAG: hypothetical protein WHV66_07935 [Anaerolineales bacterium]
MIVAKAAKALTNIFRTWVSSALRASFLTTMALNLERIVKFLTGTGLKTPVAT